MKVDVIFSAIAAPIDPRLGAAQRQVMQTIATWPAWDINDVVKAGDITLDKLCRRLHNLPRPVVFSAVAELEDLGYLPVGGVR